jgi:hypothetical protein
MRAAAVGGDQIAGGGVDPGDPHAGPVPVLPGDALGVVVELRVGQAGADRRDHRVGLDEGICHARGGRSDVLGVGDAVTVGVAAERVHPPEQLDPVEHTVAVGVRIVRIGARQHLLSVARDVFIGVGAVAKHADLNDRRGARRRRDPRGLQPARPAGRGREAQRQRRRARGPRDHRPEQARRAEIKARAARGRGARARARAGRAAEQQHRLARVRPGDRQQHVLARHRDADAQPEHDRRRTLLRQLDR